MSPRRSCANCARKRAVVLLLVCAQVLFMFGRGPVWVLRGVGMAEIDGEREANARPPWNVSVPCTSVELPLSTRTIVLSVFFTTKRDPQRRNLQYKATIKYMQNFYVSARTLGLPVLIAHDGLPDEFVAEYGTESIRFCRTAITGKLSTNDYRFFVYGDILARNVHLEYVLLTDLSDVFFWDNPFPFMAALSHDKDLFLSLDRGISMYDLGWVRKHSRACKAIPVPFNKTNGSGLARNAGVWGGHYQHVRCLIECMLPLLDNDKNCNMPVYNWCVAMGQCISNPKRIYNGGRLFNMFHRNCDVDHGTIIIHNKCLWYAKKYEFPRKPSMHAKFENLCMTLSEQGELRLVHNRTCPMTRF